ncbi:MAG: NrsF family protein [Acidobacteriota bacterium]
MEDRLLERLKEDIAGDLRPVRPLRPFWRRVLPVAGLWLLLALAVLSVFGLRADHEALGPLGTWLVPALQGLAVAALAVYLYRSIFPGSLPPQGALTGAILAALVTHIFAVAWTEHLHFNSPADHPLRAGLVCFSFVLLLGLPLLGGFVWLVRAGLFARPIRIGLLAGLAGGLAAEAAWRLHCPYTNWQHIVFSHTLGALVITALGVLYFRLRRP